MQRTKYCSVCTTTYMLKFHCPVTNQDDWYSHFTTRHIPQCPSCRKYHKLLDHSTRQNRQLQMEALQDTTKGNLLLFTLLIA
jgi:hypothetical protein